MKLLALLVVLVVALAEGRILKPSKPENNVFSNFIKQVSRSRHVYRYPRSVADKAKSSESVETIVIDQRHGNESTSSVVVNDFLEAAASAAGANVGLALSNGILGRPTVNPGYVGYPVEGAGYGGFNGGYPIGGGGYQSGIYPNTYPSTGIYNHNYDSFNQYPRPDRYPGQGHHHGQTSHHQNYYPDFQNSAYSTSYYDYQRSTVEPNVPQAAFLRRYHHGQHLGALLAAGAGLAVLGAVANHNSPYGGYGHGYGYRPQGYYYPSYYPNYYRSGEGTLDIGIQSNGQVRSDFISGNTPIFIAPTNELYSYYLQPGRLFQSTNLPSPVKIEQPNKIDKTTNEK